MDIDQIIADQFNNARAQYEKQREIQRTCIIEKLKEYRFTKHNGNKLDYSGGRGKANYTSGRKIKEFDLTNWKWIEASKNGNDYIITLQSFDQDPNSLNPHILYDRLSIGLIINKEIVDLQMTDIDLPMTQEKYSELITLLENTKPLF